MWGFAAQGTRAGWRDLHHASFDAFRADRDV